MGWFLYDRDLRHESAKIMQKKTVVSKTSDVYRRAVVVSRDKSVSENSSMLSTWQHINVPYLWSKQTMILSFLYEKCIIRILNISCYNRGQNLWNNAKKWSKIGQVGKIWNIFLRNFWLLAWNFYLWKRDWILGPGSYHFCDFPIIS